ncbi:MAG: aldo/keto reductase [Oscillospiraceae bacterium]|nr:aldo/keto reductase [Oscillospiraceae bacterium]
MISNKSIGKLGFGFMRLPKQNDKFDCVQIDEMVELFIENGYSYFDTAYIYDGSEDMLKRALVKRYPRDMFQIATKIPIYMLESGEMLNEIFNTSLNRLGTEYIDYYLLHGIDGVQNDKAEALGVWEFISEKKAEGLVKHVGFSFHGSPEDLETIIRKHPETEFVQLQINYIDWDSEDIQSKRLYEIARKYEKPIVVMEPVKGGLLASEESRIADIFRNADSQVSIASWAVRFAASLDGVEVVLSGMSSVEQLVDNIRTMQSVEKFNKHEMSLIAQAKDALNKTCRIQCTKCNYCIKSCPKNINLPQLLELYNDYLTYATISNLKHMYDFFTEDGNKASTCVSCHACENRCPQKLNIVELMPTIADIFDKD